MKVLIASNVLSSHTLNIASSFIMQGVECDVHTIEANAEYDVVRGYTDNNVNVFFHGHLAEFQRRVTLAIADVDRLIAVGGHTYGIYTASIRSSVAKTLILLGTEVIHNQGTRADIVSCYPYFSTVITPSAYLADKVAPFIDSSVTSLHVEPLGIRSVWEQQKPGKLQAIDVGFAQYFVTAKAFKWIYGHEDIIEAASSMAKTLRDTNTGFVFVGGGSDRERLQNIARKRMIEDRFLFVENMDSKTLVELVDESITAIYPSEYESYGLSLVETIVRKKKPIVYDIPGYAEVTQNGQLSITVEHGNVTELAGAIRRCIDDHDMAKQSDEINNLSSFSWDSLSHSYISACLGQKQDSAYKAQAPNLFVNKYDMFDIQKKKKNLSGARLQRTYELYREFERQSRLIHVATANQTKALSIIKKIDFSSIDTVYIEHGSIYTSLDQLIDEYIFDQALKADKKVVYFVSDYHAFDITYLKSLKFIFHKFWAYRVQRSKQRQLLLKSNHITLALPAQEISQVFPVAHDRLLELPPACRSVRHFKPKASLGRNWSLVYGGGVGPFYLLQRCLLGAQKGDRQITLFIRQKDFTALPIEYKRLLGLSNVKLIFNQDMKSNIDKNEQVGVMLMEPIDYIKTAFPVKFFDYLESGIPVLAYEDTKIGQIVKEYGLGWALPASVESISDFASQTRLDLEGFEHRRRQYLADNQWKHRVQDILSRPTGVQKYVSETESDGQSKAAQ